MSQQPHAPCACQNEAPAAFCNARTRRVRQPGLAGIEPLEPRTVLAAVVAVRPPALPSLAPVGAIQSFDGTGNNLAHPDWGSVGETLVRTAAAAYGDGTSAPSGADRPGARLVSNLLAASPADGVVNDRDYTAMVYAWGQFLDHDLGLTDTALPREQLPIAVPAGDPAFDPTGTGTGTIAMSRSAYDPATGTAVGNPRQQINAITAFIDGSQIYGSDAARAAALREFSGGRLRTSAGGLLPLNTSGLANANDAHRVADSQLFLAGDVRANENPELLALQTLFVREHNRLAAEAARRNPRWTDEQLYQHARRLVIAELQTITYREFLPALLGANSAAAAALRSYAGYRPEVQPGIATEFSTAAFRLGHSMLGADIRFLDDTGRDVRAAMALRDAFFDPRPVSEVGIDPLLKYLASDRAQEIDTQVVDDVRNFLFGAPGQGGFDLAALNIQRGRDHGLADYNTIRIAYGLPKITSFAQITPDVTIQAALRQAYGTVDKLDLWVAGLAEKHLAGSSLGETFTRILVDQFSRLRDGDRFWYRNVLSADAVRTVESTTLADVIRRNTRLTNLQGDVFFFRTSIGGTVFADANRDGRRQPLERGVPGAMVALVAAGGATVATTRADVLGNYLFKGVELGSFRVVVTAADTSRPGVSSRVVTISRGMDVRDVHVGLAPAAPPQTRPRAAAPAVRPAVAAAFAGFASAGPQGTATGIAAALPGLPRKR